MRSAVCYRHPDRETGIRCTRCERPICPECMVSASVGFQCPECVEPRPTAARRPAAHGRRRRPRRRPLPGHQDPHRAERRGVPAGAGARRPAAPAASGCMRSATSRLHRPARWASPQGPDAVVPRAHLGVPARSRSWHIGFNMLSLWWIGAPLEQRLGRTRYLALYLVSGLGGSALVLLIAPGPLTLGASGAIFGLFGATAVYMRRLRYDMRPIMILLAMNIWSSASPGRNVELAGAHRRAGLGHGDRHSDGLRARASAATSCSGGPVRHCWRLAGPRRGRCGAGHILRRAPCPWR